MKVIKRREFLGRICALGSVALPGCRLFTGADADYDDRLSVFLSDLHLRADSYQERLFAGIVAEVLRLDPLPRRAVVFGDIAYQSGEPVDYRASAPYFKQLNDAGIDVIFGMGNHDRRSGFWEVHPECRERNLLPGKVVMSISGPDADIVMLDGLQGADDRPALDMGPVPGAFDAKMCDWVRAHLPKWKRPVFVASHYPIEELFADPSKREPLGKFLIDNCPNVRGYIHGHSHRWQDGWAQSDWRTKKVLRTLCLPSTGHWGDIGYALFRTTPTAARVELIEKDFFFPAPIEQDGARPSEWDRIVNDHRGAVITFDI